MSSTTQLHDVDHQLQPVLDAKDRLMATDVTNQWDLLTVGEGPQRRALTIGPAVAEVSTHRSPEHFRAVHERDGRSAIRSSIGTLVT